MAITRSARAWIAGLAGATHAFSPAWIIEKFSLGQSFDKTSLLFLGYPCVAFLIGIVVAEFWWLYGVALAATLATAFMYAWTYSPMFVILALPVWIERVLLCAGASFLGHSVTVAVRWAIRLRHSRLR